MSTILLVLPMAMDMCLFLYHLMSTPMGEVGRVPNLKKTKEDVFCTTRTSASGV